MLRRMVVRLRKQSGMRVQSRRESTTIRFLGMENSGIGVDNRHQSGFSMRIAAVRSS